MKPRPIPPSAPWLEQLDLGLDAALRKRLVRRAMADLGIEESTQGANRSPYLDGIAQEFGSPAGSAWCALILGRWCREAGAATPPREVGAVRAWRAWAEAEGRWRGGIHLVRPGDIVLYNHSHIGLVVRKHARGLRAVEGNTSWSGFSREGVACVLKPVTMTRVAGFIVPRAAA